MRKLLLAMVFIAALLVSGSIAASADTWMPPEPFEIWSEDGSHVFRFDPGTQGWWGRYFGEPHRSWFDARTAQAAMYHNGELLYSVENLRGWAYEMDFFFSQDFQHFILLPQADFNIALEVYAHGQLVRTFYIENLVRNMRRVSRSTSKTIWIGETSCDVYSRRRAVNFLPEYDQLVITTVDGVTHTFDITTAEVTSKPFFTLPIVFSIVFGAGAIAAIILLARSKHRKGIT